MEALNVIAVNNLPSNFANDFNQMINNDYSSSNNIKEKNLDAKQENKEYKELDEHQLKEIEKELNNVSTSLNFDLNFQIHKDSGKIFVKIIDKNTHKIIKEIPPESTLDFLSKFEKMLGVLFDRRG